MPVWVSMVANSVFIVTGNDASLTPTQQLLYGVCTVHLHRVVCSLRDSLCTDKRLM